MLYMNETSQDNDEHQKHEDDLKQEIQASVLIQPQVFSAAKVNAMCACGTYLFMEGSFMEIGFPGDVSKQIENTVLWGVGSEDWEMQYLEGYCYRGMCERRSSSVLSCRSDQARRRIWTLYNGIGDLYHLSMYSFEEMRWRHWTPEIVNASMFFASSLVSGPAFIPEQDLLLVPIITTFDLSFKIVIYSFDMLANVFQHDQSSNSSYWVPWYEFEQPFVFPFEIMEVQLYGIDVYDGYVWVYGNFLLEGQADLIRVSIETKKVVPIDNIQVDETSFVTSLALGSVNGGPKLLWAGGKMSDAQGLGQVLNMAGLDVLSGKWVQSTTNLNSPSAVATIWKMSFDSDGERLVVLSMDSNPVFQLYHSGINLFFGGSTFPDASIAIWLNGVRHFSNIDISIEAPKWAVALVICCGVFVIGGITTIIILVWRRNAKKIFRYIEIPDYVSHGVKTNLNAILRDKDIIKLDPEDVKLGGVIGHGGQAVVRKAEYQGQVVAAKAIIDFSPENFSAFVKESKILACINHPNIVHMIGLLLKEDYLYLVTEMMDCDLTSILSQLNDSMKIQITVDVASAMAYLHTFQPPVLHRDLKPSNVLVARDGRVKLTDFGVSRLMAETQGKMTRDAGTLLYMAPEVWSGHEDLEYGTGSDVYSYGLLVIEVWTGNNPFHPAEFTWILEFLERMRQKIVVPGVDHMPDSCPRVICDVTRACVSWEPENRPSFAEILSKLNSNLRLESLGLIPRKPSKHSPLTSSSGVFSTSFLNISNENTSSSRMNTSKSSKTSKNSSNNNNDNNSNTSINATSIPVSSASIEQSPGRSSNLLREMKKSGNGETNIGKEKEDEDM